MIKLIAFDLDDTLVDYEKGKANAKRDITDLLIRDRIDTEAYWKSFDISFEPMYKSFIDGILGRDEYRVKRFMHLGVNEEQAAEYNEVYLRDTVPQVPLFDDVIPALERIRSYGIDMCLISNGVSDVQRKKISYNNLECYFGRIYISDEVGVGKPSDRIFRMAIEDYGIGPDEMLMVGDSPENDCYAAATAGIKAVQIIRPGLNRGDYINRITSLENLPQYYLDEL